MLLFVSNKDMKYFLSYVAVLFVQVLFVQILFVRTPYFTTENSEKYNMQFNITEIQVL